MHCKEWLIDKNAVLFTLRSVVSLRWGRAYLRAASMTVGRNNPSGQTTDGVWEVMHAPSQYNMVQTNTCGMVSNQVANLMSWGRCFRYGIIQLPVQYISHS